MNTSGTHAPTGVNGSWASSPGIRRSMQSNKGRDNGLELAVRRELFRARLRYFVHRRPLQGVRCQADIVFPKLHLAVFIDGCFWHGCPLHATRPALNKDWWAEKLDRNVARDRQHDGLLGAAGWRVLRFWEHEDPRRIAESVREAVTEGRLRT